VLENSDQYNIGDDVTEALNITKWEPVEQGGNQNSSGSYPSHICPKSDETRVQSLQALIDKFQGIPFAATVKLDGSSTTIGKVALTDCPDSFIIASRNQKLYTSAQFAARYPENGYNEPSHFEKCLINVEAFDRMSHWCMRNQRRVTLQGECIGPGIQKNKYKLPQFTIRFFTVYDLDNACYLPFVEREAILREMGLPMVPVFATNFMLPKTAEELIELATSEVAYAVPRDIVPEFMDEGLVFNPMLQEFIELGTEGKMLNANRVSFKAINPLFSLKYND
jgi:RNA ligase (TIGR02306 family)